jgi:hypothetical protein
MFSTGKSFTVDGLREKLREFFREEVRAEVRAVASLNNVELITALLSCNQQLAPIGLQLRIVNGVVSLLTTQVVNKALDQYLSEQTAASGNLLLTSATLEVPPVSPLRSRFARRKSTASSMRTSAASELNSGI